MGIRTWQHRHDEEDRSTRIMVCDGEIWIVQTYRGVDNHVKLSVKMLWKLLKRFK